MPARTITVDATSRRDASPSLATVELTAIGEGESASNARERAHDRAATIGDSLTTASAEQIRTVDVRVEDSAELFEPETDAAYRATRRLHVECTPETAANVVAEATDAGGTVRGVEFHVHEDVRRELQDDALAAAMERARRKAERMAAVEGLRVAGVREVSTKHVDEGMESIVDDALAAGSDLDLQPTPITVAERVEVVYELAEE